ncbi:MAG: hypothetical protein ACTSU2_06090 [Promethearchaeota archaeon]
MNNRRKYFGILLLSIGVLFSPVIASAPLPRADAIHPFGHYDTTGEVNGVYVDGNVVYIVDTEEGLLAIDNSDPENPVLLDKIDTSGIPNDVFIGGNIAYVASNWGLEMYDVTNPKNIVALGKYSLTLGNAKNIVVKNYVAFIACVGGGIKILDISNPQSPSLISSINTIGDAYGVEVDGNVLYAASWDYGLRVYNITDLKSPQLLSQNPTTNRFAGVKTHGDNLFICLRDITSHTDSGIAVWDIENPSNPTVSDTLVLGDYAYSLDIWGDFIFVAAGSAGVYMVNITDTSNIFMLFNYNTTGSAKDIMVSGDYVYVADGNNGLLCMPISIPFDPSETYDKIGYISLNGLAPDLAIEGDYIYVADDYGLEIFRITNPRNIALVKDVSGIGNPVSLDVEGNMAYIVSKMGGLFVIDIAAPFSAHKVAQLATFSDPTRIRISGDYAYICDNTNGFYIVNITDPFHPAVLGSYSAVKAEDLEVSGDIAYLIDYDSGVHILNISNPSSINQISSYNGEGNEFRVELDGDLLYIGTQGKNGVYVLNVTSPTAPSLLSKYQFGSNLHGLAVSGDVLLAADRSEGLFILNISAPSSISVVGKYTGLNQGEQVVCDGKLAFVSEDAGARINAILFRRSDIDDPDSDGALTMDELWHSGTDPLVGDTDGDGFNDGDEISQGSDPLDPNDPNPQHKDIAGYDLALILLTIGLIILPITKKNIGKPGNTKK